MGISASCRSFRESECTTKKDEWTPVCVNRVSLLLVSEIYLLTHFMSSKGIKLRESLGQYQFKNYAWVETLLKEWLKGNCTSLSISSLTFACMTITCVYYALLLNRRRLLLELMLTASLGSCCAHDLLPFISVLFVFPPLNCCICDERDSPLFMCAKSSMASSIRFMISPRFCGFYFCLEFLMTLVRRRRRVRSLRASWERAVIKRLVLIHI